MYYLWRRKHLAPVKEYCLSEGVLMEMAHLSLVERVNLLKTRFDTTHLTPGLLRQWYRQEKVSRQKIYQTKFNPDRSEVLQQRDQI
jgi:hypothetical protein